MGFWKVVLTCCGVFTILTVLDQIIRRKMIRNQVKAIETEMTTLANWITEKLDGVTDFNYKRLTEKGETEIKKVNEYTVRAIDDISKHAYGIVGKE